MAAIVSQ